jgi:error-prone DNA polymerase
VQRSDWECTLEPDAAGRPEVRLGLNLVSGLSESQGRMIEIARKRDGQFTHVDELGARAALKRPALEQLARSGALQGLAGHRRAAQWSVLGIETLPGALAGASAREEPPALTPPTEGESIALDYRSLGLTLGRHPLALLRAKLERLRVSRAGDLSRLRTGRKVRIAGIVTHRQRPETASGVIFMSLEDETGISNLIVWPSVQTRFRQAVFTARMLIIQGELQNEQNVTHVIVEQARDYSHWLGPLRTSSRDFH